MDKVIEYYFTPISGYAYLGHQMLHDIANRAMATIRYCPMDIVKVFDASDTTPPAKQSTTRKSYRQQDMARLAQRHSLPINISPKFWPAPGGLASKAIIASGHLELDQSQVSGAIMKGVWAMDINIADVSALQQLLDEANFPGQQIIDASADMPVQDELEEITLAAIGKGVFGSPTYVYDNERFWGQDRLGFLENRLCNSL